MTQEDKQLLLVDLCARLPYGIVADCGGEYAKIKYIDPHRSTVYMSILGKTKWESIEVITPYLRPMSSMTKEEKHIILELFNDKYVFVTNEGINADDQLTPVWKPFGLQGIRFKTMSKIIDWLNKNMFDYNGLIPMGLAIAITEENNPYKE